MIASAQFDPFPCVLDTAYRLHIANVLLANNALTLEWLHDWLAPVRSSIGSLCLYLQGRVADNDNRLQQAASTLKSTPLEMSGGNADRLRSFLEGGIRQLMIIIDQLDDLAAVWILERDIARIDLRRLNSFNASDVTEAKFDFDWSLIPQISNSPVLNLPTIRRMVQGTTPVVSSTPSITDLPGGIHRLLMTDLAPNSSPAVLYLCKSPDKKHCRLLGAGKTLGSPLDIALKGALPANVNHLLTKIRDDNAHGIPQADCGWVSCAKFTTSGQVDARSHAFAKIQKALKPIGDLEKVAKNKKGAKFAGCARLPAWISEEKPEIVIDS